MMRPDSKQDTKGSLTVQVSVKKMHAITRSQISLNTYRRVWDELLDGAVHQHRLRAASFQHKQIKKTSTRLRIITTQPKIGQTRCKQQGKVNG